ncbi:hypothetical protein [Brotaphodocola sp.]|uniref:tetratricopeptide repeat protein n=1 Tax=Brotaphodocola sp. TaxID=3073577 RepID=UPI003D7C78EF
MDKYEFNIKIEQMRKLVNRGDYETAMKIADTIDWKKVRNANLLSMVATIYEKNGEYQDSKDILLLAFERAPIGKRLLYKLTDLALKEGNIKEAEDYYREFCDLAGDDPRQQLLRYKILKQMNAPLEQQIHSLESYNAEELDEKWLYELAELYQKAGNAERCVATCDKIMLMFGLGKYVDKAMELKVQYAPLNKYQTDLVENRDKYEEKLRAVEQSFASGDGMASLEMENDSDEVDDADLLQDEQFEENEEAVAEVENTAMAESVKTAKTAESVQTENQNENQVQVSEKADADAEAVAPVETVNAETAEKAEQTATKKTAPVAVASSEVAEVANVDGNEDAETEAKSTVAESESSVCESANAVAGEESAPSQDMGVEVQEEVEPETAQRVTAPTMVAEPEEISEEIPLPKPDLPYEKENIAVAVKQAEVEQSLAREMSRLKDLPVQEDSDLGKTRVLSEIRRAPSPVPATSSTLGSSSSAFSATSKIAEKAVKIEEPEMIVEDLDEEDEAEPSIKNYLMIEARTPEKGLELAVKMLKEIHRESGRKNPVAKITGSRLNKRGILASASKLAGKDLIVEEAGDLTSAMLKELDQMIERDTTGMRILLIDNPKQMETMNRQNPFLTARFERISCESGREEESLHHVSGTSAVRPAEKSVSRAQAVQMTEAHPAKSQQTEIELELPPIGDGGNRKSEGRSAEPDYYEDGRRYAEAQKAKAKVNATATVKLSKKEEPERIERSERLERPERNDGFEFEREEERPVRQVEPVTDGAMRAPDPDPEYEQEDYPEDDGAEMDIDEFAQYCCKYASDIDCSITGKSMLALYERIEIMEEDGIALTKTAAEDLIEEAADRAEKPSMGNRLKGLFSSKYDKDGLLILKEEHFI